MNPKFRKQINATIPYNISSQPVIFYFIISHKIHRLLYKISHINHNKE
jgi:hypothetical protein